MEAFLHDNSLFVVLGIAIILWVGIAIYMFMLDSKISRLERQIVNSDEINLDENSNI
ncbi:MAG: CcmD family protein [Candidatus Kapabacteria bacterium]|nr:CcmD family protein [Ignavibacteriota bacterium]MCW5885579.1 CcmD family protein [Candidatus Kapabacteria bacterium]